MQDNEDKKQVWMKYREQEKKNQWVRDFPRPGPHPASCTVGAG